MSKNVLVVGTGTIGEPLIGLLSDFKKKMDIEVYFHKRTPLKDEVAKVNSLINRGANLVVDGEKVEAFQDLGHEPSLTYEAALDLCDIVIDCTPAGNMAKRLHYIPQLTKKKSKLFVAQGSEKDFGVPYAFGINDKTLLESTHKESFIQVVSCNTHNICSLLKSLSPDFTRISNADFVCIRRANDISQEGGFIAAPHVGAHSDYYHGTHHAADASRVLNTIYKHLPLYSSAMKINSQYMHTIRFNITLEGYEDVSRVIKKFKNNPFVCLTHKTCANKVFSFGRDHGYYGRIFNQTVVSTPTIQAMSLGHSTKISGFCFTPQDGNSLMSSLATVMYGLHGKKYVDKMDMFDKLLFDEI